MGKYPKVRKGDPLSFPAGLQNELIDFLSANANAGIPPSLVGQAAAGVVVMVKNTSGADRARWDCMALSTTLRLTITDGKESVIFDAIAVDPAKPPAILQEPIASNKFGRALIFGYTLAKVGTGSTSLLTAKPATGSKLSPDAAGSVRLLAAPSATEDTILPVLVGSGLGGGGITDLRLSGSDLQYFKDGSWTTWHTGTSC